MPCGWLSSAAMGTVLSLYTLMFVVMYYIIQIHTALYKDGCAIALYSKRE